jgi:nucleotide-binding universal stress UspA family protein
MSELSATAGAPAGHADVPVRQGPVLIAYDGRPASERALREAAALLAGPGRSALVVVVIKPELAFDLIVLPASRLNLPPAPIDIRTALEVEQEMYDNAQAAAQRAAGLLGSLGLEAEGVVVSEDPEITVAETVVRVARERDAQVVVVGAHLHGGRLGGTSRAVVKEAPCPALVVREPTDEKPRQGADR